MRPKAASMIKFSYVFVVFNLLVALYYYVHYRMHILNEEVAADDRGHVVMFLAGSMMWVVCVLVWSKTHRDENEDAK
jgi:hypothetical protein